MEKLKNSRRFELEKGFCRHFLTQSASGTPKENYLGKLLSKITQENQRKSMKINENQQKINRKSIENGCESKIVENPDLFGGLPP